MIRVVLFRGDDGSTPFLDWFARLRPRTQDRCTERIERLRELGHLLRRPEADFLRDGIYELRIKDQGINYRVLYFFHGQAAVVLSHGIAKQRAAVPPSEIERARKRRMEFLRDPKLHTTEVE